MLDRLSDAAQGAASGVISAAQSQLSALLSQWTSAQRLYTLEGDGGLSELMVERFSLIDEVSEPYQLSLSTLSLNAQGSPATPARPASHPAHHALGRQRAAARSGLIMQAAQGPSDGGLARYQLSGATLGGPAAPQPPQPRLARQDPGSDHRRRARRCGLPRPRRLAVGRDLGRRQHRRPQRLPGPSPQRRRAPLLRAIPRERPRLHPAPARPGRPGLARRRERARPQRPPTRLLRRQHPLATERDLRRQAGRRRHPFPPRRCGGATRRHPELRRPAPTHPRGQRHPAMGLPRQTRHHRRVHERPPLRQPTHPGHRPLAAALRPETAPPPTPANAPAPRPNTAPPATSRPTRPATRPGSPAAPCAPCVLANGSS